MVIFIVSCLLKVKDSVIRVEKRESVLVSWGDLSGLCLFYYINVFFFIGMFLFNIKWFFIKILVVFY